MVRFDGCLSDAHTGAVSGRWPLSSSTPSHRRSAACYSWLKGTKRSLGIATTAAAVAARAPNDRAVDHGSVGRWSHGTLLARFVSHCRGLDRLQQARAQQAPSFCSSFLPVAVVVVFNSLSVFCKLRQLLPRARCEVGKSDLEI